MSADSQAQQVAAYWDGHPNPPETTATPGQVAAHKVQLDAWRNRFGPAGPPAAPSPPEIPGPPTPGAGMPAARAGDLTAHGGTIGLVVTGVAAKVLIGGQPAACMGDAHVCPMCDGPKPHVGGTILKGSATVVISNMPVARVSDTTECKGPPGAVALGCQTVLIGDLGAVGAAPAGRAARAASAVRGGGAEEDAGDMDRASVDRTPGPPTQTVGTGVHWLELELVNEAEQPVPGEAYCVILPDESEVAGALDAQGRVRIEGIEQAGPCRISFPRLDAAAWESWETGSGPGATQATATAPASAPRR